MRSLPELKIGRKPKINASNVVADTDRTYFWPWLRVLWGHLISFSISNPRNPSPAPLSDANARQARLVLEDPAEELRA